MSIGQIVSNEGPSLGPASSYLGIQITRDHKHQIIWIDQGAYIENTLKRFGLQDANNAKTPLPARVHLEKSEGLATTKTKTSYQQMIGTVMTQLREVEVHELKPKYEVEVTK